MGKGVKHILTSSQIAEAKPVAGMRSCSQEGRRRGGRRVEDSGPHRGEGIVSAPRSEIEKGVEPGACQLRLLTLAA